MCDHCGCREYQPIAQLTVDHEEILRLAWDLAESDDAHSSAAEALRDELVARLDAHVEAEETWLYPALRSSGDLTVASSEALESDHRSLRARVLSGSFERRDFYALAAHIEEEEFELFPSAMFGFEDDVWLQAPVPAP